MKKLKLPLLLLLFAITLVCLIKPKAAFAEFHTSKIIPSTYQNYGVPRDLTLLQNGDAWYADSQNSRIVKISTSSGQILRTVGRAGTGEGEFAQALKSITHDDNGNLYVLDACNVYKLDFNGGQLAPSWGGCGDGGGSQLSVATAITYSRRDGILLVSDTVHNRIVKFGLDGTYLGEFGSAGTGLGQFNSPLGLTTDAAGNIYVVDGGNSRVQVFPHDGSPVYSFGGTNPGDYELNAPKDVEVMDDGTIVVTSQNAQLIKTFTAAGVFQAQWGQNGGGEDQFTAPAFMTRGDGNSIWLSDWQQRRLQHFDVDGTHRKTIGNGRVADGSFVAPFSVAFDSVGKIYVLDGTGRVQRFSADGTFESVVITGGQVGAAFNLAISPITGNIAVAADTKVFVFAQDGTLIDTVGTHGLNGGGAGEGDFNNAKGLAFDSAGLLYVADEFNHRIQKFDLTHISDVDFDGTYDGGYLGQWTVMDYPENIFIDSSNKVYVSSAEGRGGPLTIQQYDTDGGSNVTHMDKYGSNPDQYSQISGIFIASDGKTYISDPQSNRIQIYNTDGSLAESVGSYGGDLDQFDVVRSAALNPVTDDLVAVDTNNYRIKILTNGFKILNLISSADVVDATNGLSLVQTAVEAGTPGITNVPAKLYFGNYVVSDFDVNLSSDRNWASVGTTLLANDSKSLVARLNPTDAPGVSSTHSLFVVKHAGQNAVRICTEATAITDVVSGCVGYTLHVGDPTLSTTTIDGIEYWKITGLTGTGALAETISPSPTPTSAPAPASGSSSTSSSSNSGSGGSSSPTTCDAAQPAGMPDLFQINAQSATAQLFFTPVSGAGEYAISYGTQTSAEMYGTRVSAAGTSVQAVTIGALKPGTTYYFKVRGQNGCMPGDWSNTLKIVTRPKSVSRIISFYKTGLPKSSSLVVVAKKLGQSTTAQTPVVGEVQDAAHPLLPVVTPKVQNLPDPAPTPAPKKCRFLWFWCSN